MSKGFGALPSPRFIPILNNAAVLLILVTDKFTESMYILANEPSVALYRLQEHVRRSLPELAQHKVRASLGQESRAGRNRVQAAFLPMTLAPLAIFSDSVRWERTG